MRTPSKWNPARRSRDVRSPFRSASRLASRNAAILRAWSSGTLQCSFQLFDRSLAPCLSLQRPLDAMECGVDFPQRGCACAYLNEREIHVDRQPLQIAHEEVDRRASFQREAALARDERQDADQQ